MSGGDKRGKYQLKLKKYSCPLCHQASSRKWNIIIHIARKHPGSNVEPILTTSLRETNSSFVENASDERIYRTSFGPKAGEGNNALDTINETLGKMIKYKRQLVELVPDSMCFDPFNHVIPPSELQSIQLGQAYFDWLCSSEFTPEKDPLRHLTLVFESYICSQCLVHMPLSFYGTRGSTKIIRSYHRCNQSRLGEVKNLSDEEKYVERFILQIATPDKMLKAIKEWWTDNNSPYVIAVKLRSIPTNSYDFTNIGGVYDWLHSAMQGVCLLLDDNQLREFLFITGGNTYVSFSIIIRQGDSEIIESYFVTLSKEQYLPVIFYVDNPPIPPLRAPRCLSTGGNFTLYSAEEKT
jgi:hypothetical protein